MDWKYYDVELDEIKDLDQDVIDRIVEKSAFAECDIHDLFEFSTDDLIVECSMVWPTRARENGIINASHRMVQAMQGLRKRRVPVAGKLNSHLNRYILADGNSTYFVCKLWGIASIPLRITTS